MVGRYKTNRSQKHLVKKRIREEERFVLCTIKSKVSKKVSEVVLLAHDRARFFETLGLLPILEPASRVLQCVSPYKIRYAPKIPEEQRQIEKMAFLPARLFRWRDFSGQTIAGRALHPGGCQKLWLCWFI